MSPQTQSKSNNLNTLKHCVNAIAKKTHDPTIKLHVPLFVEPRTQREMITKFQWNILCQQITHARVDPTHCCAKKGEKKYGNIGICFRISAELMQNFSNCWFLRILFQPHITANGMTSHFKYTRKFYEWI